MASTSRIDIKLNINPVARIEIKLNINPITTVVKIARRGGVVVQWCDVYIGRECKMGGWNLPCSIWHNPYKTGTLEERISKYREHIINNPVLMARLPELRGKVLGCWCKPGPCHGDILIELLDKYYPV